MVFWPTAWCIELSNTSDSPNVYLLTLFFLESFILHGAGLILNDIFDRSIDSQVIISITFLIVPFFHNTNKIRKQIRFNQHILIIYMYVIIMRFDTTGKSCMYVTSNFIG
jgi:uncharacterized membrane protein YkvI